MSGGPGCSQDISSHPATRRAFLASTTGIVGSVAGCFVRGEESAYEGEIRVDGSNTVLPHSAALSEEFMWRNNRVQIPVRGSGTGAGFERFCRGETDIQNASRQISDSEIDLCEQNDISFLELTVALDGIALWVNTENDWAECLTVEEIHQIWRSGSTVETWQDIRPEWPNEEITLYGRDPASGTFDSFTAAVNNEVGNIRSDYSASADTNVIVRGVRGSRYALGFGGAGYYYENQDDLKLLAVDDDASCIYPRRETIETGEYTPLTREMYLYINADALRRPEVGAFAGFYFTQIESDTHEQAVLQNIAEPGESLTWTQWGARKVGFYGISESTVGIGREKLTAALNEGET